MKFKENNVINVLNLTIKNSLENSNFLLSNISFKIQENETIGFYFNQENEKDAFTSIFSKKNLQCSGLILVENEAYNTKSKPIYKISEVHSISEIEKFDSKKRVIEYLERKIVKSQYNEILDVIKVNNKLEKHIKMLKIFRYKNIEYAYIKAINSYIEKSVVSLEKMINNLKQNSAKVKNDIFLFYEQFVNFHTNYLKDRINFTIERNIALMNLFFKKLKSIEYNKELFNASQNLVNQISDLYMFDSNLLKYKNEFIRTFGFPKKDEEIQDFKLQNDIINNFILDMKYKLDLYNKSLKKTPKNSKDYFLYYKRKIICNKFIKLVKKEQKELIYTNKDQAISLFKNLSKKYKNILIKQEEVFEGKKNKIKYEINRYIKNELTVIFNEYKVNIENNKIEQDKSNESKYITESITKDELAKLAIKLKNDSQNLIDEIEWKKKIAFFNINENTNNLINIIKKELKTYESLKSKYNKLLLNFLDIKNDFIKKDNNLSKEAREKLNDSFFANEALKYEVIYNFLNKDIKILEKLFIKQTLVKQNIRNNEIFILIRYKILNSCKEFKLSIFDLLKRIGKIDNLTKSTILMLTAYHDSKKISIIENLFYTLNQDLIKSFSETYNSIAKKSNKCWILIEPRLDKLKYVANYLSIIDNSKQIEFGDKNSIINHPIYQTTIEAVGLKIETLERTTPKIFSNIIDFNYDYDYFKLGNSHYFYGNIQDIYKWSKAIPQECSRTILIDNLKKLQNKIMFSKLNSKVSHNSQEKNKYMNKDEFISKEYLIIDVKK